MEHTGSWTANSDRNLFVALEYERCRRQRSVHLNRVVHHSILGAKHPATRELLRANVSSEYLRTFPRFIVLNSSKDFWKNISAPISNTNIRIELMDPNDKRAVSASFRLFTQHLLNYTT